MQHNAVVRQDDERVRRPRPEHLDELVRHLNRPGEGGRDLAFHRRTREDLGVAFPERFDRFAVRFHGFVVGAAVGALAQLGERAQLQIGGPGQPGVGRVEDTWLQEPAQRTVLHHRPRTLEDRIHAADQW